MISLKSRVFNLVRNIACTHSRLLIKALYDRAACLIERYQGRDINPDEFEQRWGEPPSKLSIIRGPRFLQRLPSLGEEDPEPKADGINRLEPDRDTEWETEEEEEGLVQEMRH
jgi:hypothetical protein